MSEGWLELTAGDVRWQLAPEQRDRLFGPDGLRLPEWLSAGLARTVKHGAHRTVYRAALPGVSCYIKHYRLHNLRAWLRELVRPSKARMEYERALAVAARGVPTFVPLAFGECRDRLGPNDSYLITQAIEGAEPLHAFLEGTLPRFDQPTQTRVRQRLAGALGKLIARMHDAGIAHHDLHAGNLLIRLDEGQPRLWLIDLHAVHLGPPLGWRASRANLILFNRWCTMRVSRTDRLRFWHAYCRARQRAGRKEYSSPHLSLPNTGARGEDALPVAETGWPTEGEPGATAVQFRAMAQELERGTWHSNLRFWRGRDRRCLGSNRYFRTIRTPLVTGHALADLDAAALAPLLADPDEPFRRPGAIILKNSRSSTVAELELPIGGQMRRVIYKRFRLVAWSDPYVGLVRWTPALRSWYHGHGLLDRGVPTARPLAVLHRRRRGLLGEGYLLAEKIPDALELRGYVVRLSRLPPGDGRAALRRCIDRVARLIRELHRRHISHRDLKAVNILVSAGDEKFWLIDLVGVRRHRRLPRTRRVQNLTRLNASFFHDPAVTRSDKLRFLRVYLQWGLRGKEGWKSWWREIEEATRAKVARNVQRGRPLA